MRGMINSVEQAPNGLLVLNIGGIKFRCYQELDKLGAGKKDVVDYDAVYDNDPRFTGTIVWIRKVPQSQQFTKAFNLSDKRMIKTAATRQASPKFDALKKNKKARNNHKFSSEACFNYEKTLAREMWSDVLRDGKDLFKIHFDTENNDNITEPFRLRVKETSFLCQAWSAGGDWENPVLYYRIQLLDRPQATKFESFGTEISEHTNPFFVFIPNEEDGNSNLKKGKGGKLHATQDDDSLEVSERKGRKALKKYLEDCIKPVKKSPELPGEKDAVSNAQVKIAKRSTNPKFEMLQKNKKDLTDEEREKVMDAKAIWHHGPKGKPSPAVWKSEVDGETWFVTNTHRAFQARKTLDSAIKAFHDFIKKTAAKGDPTGTNLYVLKQYFEQSDEIPNGALKPVDVPHMRRCLQAGLIEVVGGRDGVLRLTEAGRQAIRGTESVAFNLRDNKTGMKATTLRTFSSIRAEYANKGKHHCLRLVCSECGNVETCRCSSPKTTETGICPYCREDETSKNN